MISIGEQHLDAALEQVLTTLRPHRGVRADRHEGGCEYFVVARTEPSGARPRARRRGFEGKIQPLHAGGGYRLPLQKGRFAPRDTLADAPSNVWADCWGLLCRSWLEAAFNSEEIGRRLLAVKCS